METIVTLIVGGITGWIASMFMKTNAQMGIVANVIVGVVGFFSAIGLPVLSGSTSRVPFHDGSSACWGGPADRHPQGAEYFW